MSRQELFAAIKSSSESKVNELLQNENAKDFLLQVDGAKQNALMHTLLSTIRKNDEIHLRDRIFTSIWNKAVELNILKELLEQENLERKTVFTIERRHDAPVLQLLLPALEKFDLLKGQMQKVVHSSSSSFSTLTGRFLQEGTEILFSYCYFDLEAYKLMVEVLEKLGLFKDMLLSTHPQSDHKNIIHLCCAQSKQHADSLQYTFDKIEQHDPEALVKFLQARDSHGQTCLQLAALHDLNHEAFCVLIKTLKRKVPSPVYAKMLMTPLGQKHHLGGDQRLDFSLTLMISRITTADASSIALLISECEELSQRFNNGVELVNHPFTKDPRFPRLIMNFIVDKLDDENCCSRGDAPNINNIASLLFYKFAQYAREINFCQELITSRLVHSLSNLFYSSASIIVMCHCWNDRGVETAFNRDLFDFLNVMARKSQNNNNNNSRAGAGRRNNKSEEKNSLTLGKNWGSGLSVGNQAPKVGFGYAFPFKAGMKFYRDFFGEVPRNHNDRNKLILEMLAKAQEDKAACSCVVQ